MTTTTLYGTEMVKISTILLTLTLSICIHGIMAVTDKRPGIKSMESRFATKTVYKHRIPLEESLPWNASSIPDRLKPISIYAILRHGTRYPSEKRINKWKIAVPKFKILIRSSNNFSDTVKDNVLNWRDEFKSSSYYLLSSLGWEEHVLLGNKYYSMMPGLFDEVLNPSATEHDDLLVLSSNKVRAKASAQAFLSGLHHASKNLTGLDHPDVKYEEWKVQNESNQVNEQNVVQYNNFPVLINDKLLRFFDHCDKYVHDVDENDTADVEFDNFFKSKEMEDMSDRFGEIPKNKDIYYIYQLCAFEKAVFGNSVWCDVFNDADFDLFEYASDLKHYYITGHGYDINVEQSCSLLKHMLHRFDQKRQESCSVTLGFGHAETLIPLVSLLGFYEETTALGSNNHAQHGDRVFRTGKISPFAGNLAIAVYENKLNPDQQYVSFVLNEQIVKPFGLDCYFCEFGNDSIVYRKLQEKLVGCEDVCDRAYRDEL